MLAKDLMSKNPKCCVPETSLQEVALTMVEEDCGAVPVVDDVDLQGPLLGMITDRDIVCRALAKGKNPLEMRVGEAMTTPALFVKPDDTLEHCLEFMEEAQVRRMPVADEDGTCVGIITQARIAREGGEEAAAALVQSVSRKSRKASNVEAYR